MSIQSVLAFPATVRDAGKLDTTFAAEGTAQVYFFGSTSSLANDIAIDSQRPAIGGGQGDDAGWQPLWPGAFAQGRFSGPGFRQTRQRHRAIRTEASRPCGRQGKGAPNGHILIVGLQYESEHRTLPALALFDLAGPTGPAFCATMAVASCGCLATFPKACAMSGYLRAYQAPRPAASTCRTTVASCWWPIITSNSPIMPPC